MTRGSNKLRRALLVAFLVIIVAVPMVLVSLQRAIIFPHKLLHAPEEPMLVHPQTERLWLDDPRVEAWFIPGRGVDATHPGPLVIFAHGNGELIDDWAQSLTPYLEMGVSLLLPEYRGYGRSEGDPSEEHLREDMRRFYDLVVARPE